MKVRAEKCHRLRVNWVTQVAAPSCKPADSTKPFLQNEAQEVLVHTVNIVTSVNQGKKNQNNHLVIINGGKIQDTRINSGWRTYCAKTLAWNVNQTLPAQPR